MVTFFEEMIFVLTSIIDQQQKSYPSTQFVQIMFSIQFLQRFSLLFPFDGFNQNIYSDFYISYARKIMSPSSIGTLLYLYEHDILSLIICFIIVIVFTSIFMLIPFLTLLYRFNFFNPVQPHAIYKAFCKILYTTFNYLEYIVFIPSQMILTGIQICGFNSILLSQRQQQCQWNYFYIMILITQISVFILIVLQTYFFRSQQFWPDNMLKKKYSFFTTFIPIIQFGLIVLNFMQSNNLTNYIRFLLANFFGILWILEVFLASPYRPPINQMMFKLACLYESSAIILTAAITTDLTIIQLDQIVFYITLLGLLIYYVSDTFYEDFQFKILSNQNSKSQFKIIYLIQLYNYLQLEGLKVNKNQLTSQDVKLLYQWYFAFISHEHQCTDTSLSKLTIRKLMKLGLQHTKPLTKTIILCILQTNFKQNQGVNLELLELVYISFQMQEFGSPLPAYCILKIYQQKENLHSFYFKCIKESLNEQLKEAILEKQQLRMLQNSRDYLQKELSTADIHHGYKHEEKYLQKIKQIVDMKVTYWQKLLAGYNQLEDFGKDLKHLSSTSLILEKELELEMSFDSKVKFSQKAYNVIILKLLSLYYGAILNDFDNTQKCEYQIEEILKYERSLSKDLVLNQSILNDKVILMSISTIKNQGTINFQDKKKLANFFGFDGLQDFSTTNHINQLMPLFVIKKHDSILEKYLKIGTSDRFTSPRLIFILNKKGFVFPVNIKLENFFEQKDDYVLTASFSKVRESSEFIVFNQKGKILALTENAFGLLCPINNNSIQIKEILSKGYIFFIFPQIFNILIKERENLSSSEGYSIQIENKCSLQVSNNLIETIQQFYQFKQQEENYSLLKRITKPIIRRDEEMIQFDNENHVSADSDEIMSEELNSETYMMGCHILLLEKEYQDLIFDFLSLPEISENRFVLYEYLVKFHIRYKIMGNGANSQPYFYLEINDFVKRGQTKSYLTEPMNLGKETNRSSDSRFSQLSKTQIKYKKEHFNPQIDISLVTPMNQSESSNQYVLSNTEEERQMANHEIIEQKQPAQEEIIDSARGGSISIGPLSQRARFVNPGQISLNEDFREIEKDFKDILNQYSNQQDHLSGLRLKQENFRLDLINENENEEGFEFNDFQIKQKNSSQKQDCSQQIEKILRQNKTQIKQVFGDSSSSYSGKSSNRECNSILHNIKYKRSMNKYLKFSLYYLIIGAVLFLAFNLTNLLIDDQLSFRVKQEINNCIAPLKLGKYYYKIFLSGWIYLIQRLGMIDQSDYIETQLNQQRKIIENSVLTELQDFYQIFLQCEQQNLLKDMTIRQVLSEDLTSQKFSLFYFQIREKFEEILRNDLTSGFLDKTFIYDVLFLRLNMDTFMDLNEQLLFSIEILITGTIDDLIKQLNIILILELIILSLIIFLPLLYIRNLVKYEKGILLLVTRINEQIASQMMMRFLIIKEIFEKNQSLWKKTDFASLLFKKLDLMHINSYQVDLKFLKNRISLLEGGESSKANTNKNLNLTQKFENTNLSISRELFLSILVFSIFFLQLLGGRLLSLDHQSQITPYLNLTINFIDYTLTYFTVIASGIILKTEYLVMPKLKEFDIFEINQKVTEHNFNISSNDKIIEIFINNSNQLSNRLSKLIEDITQMNQMSQADKQLLANLFSESLCFHLQEIQMFPFCDDKVDSDEFSTKYGKPSSVDNNREYLEKGLIGLNAQTTQIINSNFFIELNSKSYDSNIKNLLQFVQSKEFKNLFIQNFLDYVKAYDEFVSFMISTCNSKIDSNFQVLLEYYLITTIFIGLLYAFGLRYWIVFRNKQVYLIRLGISNIPFELLQDQQVIMALKKVAKVVI